MAWALALARTTHRHKREKSAGTMSYRYYEKQIVKRARPLKSVRFTRACVLRVTARYVDMLHN